MQKTLRFEICRVVATLYLQDLGNRFQLIINWSFRSKCIGQDQLRSSSTIDRECGAVAEVNKFSWRGRSSDTRGTLAPLTALQEADASASTSTLRRCTACEGRLVQSWWRVASLVSSEVWLVSYGVVFSNQSIVFDSNVLIWIVHRRCRYYFVFQYWYSWNIFSVQNSRSTYVGQSDFLLTRSNDIALCSQSWSRLQRYFRFCAWSKSSYSCAKFYVCSWLRSLN